MRLRSFTADSLAEAMDRVRETLGPDAVILSNQPADDGKGIRVTAALEDSPLEDLTFGGPLGAPVSIDEIGEALAYHRVPPGLFDRLVGAAAALPAGDEILALGAALDNELVFAALPEAPMPRPIILVGPPGAGKTATAAKLCARVRLAGGEADLITMDTAKSGGLAQIAAFAKALGARLEPAPDIDTLAAVVAACPKGRFVAIDTVGCNPFDGENMGHLALATRAAGADAIAILPAGGDAADCAEAAVAFAEAGARRLIVTRIDVARRFGGVLSAAQAGGLALIAAGASPNISDGLLPLNPISLARLLLPARARFGDTASARGTG